MYHYNVFLFHMSLNVEPGCDSSVCKILLSRLVATRRDINFQTTKIVVVLRICLNGYLEPLTGLNACRWQCLMYVISAL